MFESIKVGGRGSASALVLGVFSGKQLDKASAALDASGSALRASKLPETTGDVGQVVHTAIDGAKKGSPRSVYLVGLGDAKSLNAAKLRAAAAALGRAIARTRHTTVSLELAPALKSAKMGEHEGGRAMGEALGLLGWTYDTLRGSATDVPTRNKLAVKSSSSKLEAGLEHGIGLAEGSNRARTLSQTPPNIATTSWMAAQARKLARETGMKCTIIKGSDLEKHNLQGLINVGKASENEPCMIRLEYTPAAATHRKKKPAVLVGKTMTYDSGGLSIKVGGGMRGMKRDKDGGCAVFGAMHSVATVVKPRRPVVALLPCAENSISDEAYRPDDVIEFMNGVTVEVTNTDAEGRLILADALCWACAKEDPAFIVDMATLTGGVVVALGSAFAGLWCDDDDLRERLETAGLSTGERVWRLPHDEKYNDLMRSPIADIHNSAPVREAHPIQGAAFLSYFVDKAIPWAHVDIAGTHSTDKDSGPYIAGPTGFGSRLAAELLASE